MTGRRKIAERVAHGVKKSAEKELERHAHERLTGEEIDELAEWIEVEAQNQVNGTLKMKAAEKHGHDIVPDGGRETLHFADGYLSLPDEIDASEGLVIRARGITVDHKPGGTDRDEFPIRRCSLVEDEHPQNDHLEMYEVSLKPYREEPRRYDVLVLEADGGLVCDVSGCGEPAAARVYPTNGRTNHTALRCWDCLDEDRDSNHFAEWRAAIERERDIDLGEGIRTDGGAPDHVFHEDGERP